MQGSVREIAVDIVSRRRPPAAGAGQLGPGHATPTGEPRWCARRVFDATERKRYERELLAARDRERDGARAASSGCSAITAALAAAPDADAIAAAVSGELTAAFGAADRGRGQDRPATRVRQDAELGSRSGRAGSRAGCGCDFAEPREFTADERAFLIAVARQTALALERARLYEETRDVAHTLQQSMLAGRRRRTTRASRSRRSTSRPSSTSRSAATGTTRSRCPAARSGSWSATSSAAGCRRQRDGPAAQRGARARRRRASGRRRSSRHLDTFVEQVEATPVRDARLRGGRSRPPARSSSPPPATSRRSLLGRGEPRALPRRPLDAAGRHAPALPRTEARFTLAPGDGLRPLHRRPRRAPRASRSTSASSACSTRSRRTRTRRPQDLVDALLEPAASERRRLRARLPPNLQPALRRVS